MPVRFNPTGSLNIASDPADLPSQAEGKVEVSGAMQRCTNLHLDRAGIASTRRGSAKLSTTAIGDTESVVDMAGIRYPVQNVYRLIEQAGVRYEFAGTRVYKDETAIGAGYLSAPWTALLYNSYATNVQSVFATNGSDRIRIEDEDIHQWGSESPTKPPYITYGLAWGLTGAYNAKYTWARKEGDTVVWESNPSPAAPDAVTLTDETLRISCPQPTDPQITHLRIYRTLVDGANYYWDRDVPIYAPDLTVYTKSYIYGKFIETPDLTEYTASYMYAWELLDYVTTPGYGAFYHDIAADRVHTTYWEAFYAHEGNYEYRYETIAGWSCSYPWENDLKNSAGWEQEYHITDSGYQCFQLDTVTHRAYIHDWEDYYTSILGDTEHFDTKFKFTHPWENDLYNSYWIDTFTADDELGDEVYWVTHDRPPLNLTQVVGPGFNGVCFGLVDNNLYYCMPNQPEYWPENYYIEVCTKQYPLKAVVFLDGALFVASTIEIYSIQGSGPGTFFPLPMSAQTGTVNPDCFVAVKGFGIFHLGYDGIYQYSAGKDQLISRGEFEPLFRGETKGSVIGLNREYIENCWMQSFHGKFYFAYPGIGSAFPDNMIIIDLLTNRSVHHTYPVAFKLAAIDNANARMLAVDVNGYVWTWDVLTLTDDDGAAIDWQIQSKDFSQYYKYFPRYAKYDVQVIDGTAQGEIIMDDMSKQTHLLTGDRLTRKRLVDTCTGDRLAVRLSGQGRVNIYGTEIE